MTGKKMTEKDFPYEKEEKYFFSLLYLAFNIGTYELTHSVPSQVRKIYIVYYIFRLHFDPGKSITAALVAIL